MKLLLTCAMLLFTSGVAQSQSTDLPPTTPTNLIADAYGKTAGEVRWTRATDDRGAVRGYEITRD